jgi:hypothetical protein
MFEETNYIKAMDKKQKEALVKVMLKRGVISRYCAKGKGIAKHH